MYKDVLHQHLNSKNLETNVVGQVIIGHLYN